MSNSKLTEETKEIKKRYWPEPDGDIGWGGYIRKESAKNTTW